MANEISVPSWITSGENDLQVILEHAIKDWENKDETTQLQVN